MTYSIYFGNRCLVSGLTYTEAKQYCIDKHLVDAEIWPDDGEVNE